MRFVITKHQELWGKNGFLSSVIFGIGLLIVSLAINYAAGIYANSRASNAVTDIFLSNIPALDVNSIFIYGTEIFFFFVIGVLLYEPKALPFTLKSVALFVLTRSFFISLTHIGAFPHTQPLNAGTVLQLFNFNSDLFFSGHTGMPFLLALIFWQQRALRIIFLLVSTLFGAIVLLGHLHYSIDVFSAFFITYTIFHVAKELFYRDFLTLLGKQETKDKEKNDDKNNRGPTRDVEIK